MNRNRLKHWIMLLLPLLIVGLVLVACDDDDGEEGAGGGLDATPDITETEEFPVETPVTEMTDTPEMVEETPVVEETVVVSPTAAVTVTMEATEVMTDVATPTDTVETEQSSGVILASDLIGINVEDGSGENIGSVTEALADVNGEILYVVVDLDGLLADDDAGETVTDTVETDPADEVEDFDLAVLTWDDFTVSFDLTDDELLEDDRDFDLVLNGSLDTMTVAMLDADFLGFLEEDDYVLDEVVEDDDLDIPVDYAGLIQVRAYDEFEVENTAEDDLGDTDDLLIDVETGRILYAIIDIGGFLGIGESEVAIPWAALTLDAATLEDDSEIFRIDVDVNFLEEAPTIDLDDWASEVEEGWDQIYRDYWIDFVEEF